jgi:hypothetical protein
MVVLEAWVVCFSYITTNFLGVLYNLTRISKSRMKQMRQVRERFDQSVVSEDWRDLIGRFSSYCVTSGGGIYPSGISRRLSVTPGGLHLPK